MNVKSIFLAVFLTALPLSSLAMQQKNLPVVLNSTTNQICLSISNDRGNNCEVTGELQHGEAHALVFSKTDYPLQLTVYENHHRLLERQIHWGEKTHSGPVRPLERLIIYRNKHGVQSKTSYANK